MSDHALPLRLLPDQPEAPAHDALVESYRRLADVFHDVLAEQSLDALLDRIADALADLVPHDSLTIYEADVPRRMLNPVWARDKWADKILADKCPFGVGLTGWGWFWVILAVLLDLGHLTASIARRRELVGRA